MTLESPTHPLQANPPAVLLRLSVDLALFTLRSGGLHVLLRRRAWEPFAGWRALPGAINPPNEQIADTMLAELNRIGLDDIAVDQLKTFDRPPEYVDGALARPGRDPRGRVVSVAYIGLVSPDRASLVVESDALSWTPVTEAGPLAFDHDEILRYALWRLRNKILYSSTAFLLLPPCFTLTQLQRVYEQVLGESLDKRNFRRKVLDAGVVVETGAVTQEGTRRPARLYRYAEREFEFR
jgi:8-oxo-dGTP diphosphatase